MTKTLGQALQNLPREDCPPDCCDAVWQYSRDPIRGFSLCGSGRRAHRPDRDLLRRAGHCDGIGICEGEPGRRFRQAQFRLVIHSFLKGGDFVEPSLGGEIVSTSLSTSPAC